MREWRKEAALDLDDEIAHEPDLAEPPWPGRRPLTTLVTRTPVRPAERGRDLAALRGRIDRRASGAADQPAGDLEAVLGRLAGSAGFAMPAQLSARLSRALGADVSRVRLHTDSAAASAAEALHAEAFALGDDVYFGANRYHPDSDAGERLIAHEVAHTVQQRGAATTSELTVSRPDDAHEIEADRFANAFSGSKLYGPDDAPLVAPVRAGTVARVVSRFGGPDFDVVPMPDLELLPARSYSGGKALMPPINHTLVDQTVLVDGVPIDIGAKAKGSANSYFNAGYGPVALKDVLIETNSVKPTTVSKPTPAPPFPIPYYPKSVPVPSIETKGTAWLDSGAFTFTAGFIGFAGAEASLGVARNLFKLAVGGGLTLIASIDAKAQASVSHEISFISPEPRKPTFGTTTLHLWAGQTLNITLLANTWLELSINFPDIPILKELASGISDWPIVGGVARKLSGAEPLWSKKWMAEKELAKWTSDKHWQLETDLDIGATAGTATISESKGPQAFDFASAMKELDKQTGHNDIPKEVEGQKAGAKGGPSQIAAAAHRAKASIAGAKKVIKKQLDWNVVQMDLAKKAHAKEQASIAAASASGAPPPLAVGGTPNDPVVKMQHAHDTLVDLEKRGIDNGAERAESALDGAKPEPGQGAQIVDGHETVAENANQIEQAADDVDQGIRDDGKPTIEEVFHERELADEALIRIETWHAGENQDVVALITEHGKTVDPDIRAWVTRLEAYRDQLKELKDLRIKPLRAQWNKVNVRDADAFTRFKEIEKDARAVDTDLNKMELPSEPDYDTVYAEIKNGEFVVAGPYAKDIRGNFYEMSGYGPDVDKWKAELLSKKVSEGGIIKDDDPTMYLYAANGQYYSLKDDPPTWGHEDPTVAGHWNFGYAAGTTGVDGTPGRFSTHAKRLAFFRGGDDYKKKLFIQPTSINSKDGSKKKDGTFMKQVSAAFRGRG